MNEETLASVDGPERKRPSWSLKTIVEDVAGVPIRDLQDPAKPVHPYVKMKLDSASTSVGRTTNTGPNGDSRASAPSSSTIPDDGFDPVARVYPPLVGPTGRALHGPEGEHHQETIERFRNASEPPSPGTHLHSPGPSRRPERIYLHYLLLHMDRLSDSALRYLKHAVDEEVTHREKCHYSNP